MVDDEMKVGGVQRRRRRRKAWEMMQNECMLMGFWVCAAGGVWVVLRGGLYCCKKVDDGRKSKIYSKVLKYDQQ